LTVARSLIGVAAEIKIVELPELPAKGDIVDFVAARGAQGKTDIEIDDEIRALIEAAPVFTVESAPAAAEVNETGLYRASEHGFTYVRLTDEGAEIIKPISNFTAEIKREILRDDGDQVTRHFEIEMALKGRHYSGTVPANEYSAMSRVLEIDLSVHFHGQTGRFKTALATLVQQHFGSGFDARHLPAAWSPIAYSLQWLCFLAKDAVLVVDDFSPTGSRTERDRLNREADHLMRAQGNSAGRNRLRADATLRQSKQPRGLLISTGEDLFAGHSLIAPVANIEVRGGDVDMVKLTAAQTAAAAGLYAAAMSGYLSWLVSRFDAIRGELRSRVADLRAKVCGNRDVAARTTRASALALL
jgi:hypothetical protein